MKTHHQLLLGLFIILSTPAAVADAPGVDAGSSGAIRIADVGGARLLAPDPGAEDMYIPLPGLHTHVRIGVTGVAARVAITQEFRNPSTRWLEAVYVFPMPEDGAVTGLRMQIADRVIEGVVKEKRRARQQYTAARNSGRKASLVDQQRPNLFTSSVANIPPGKSVTITLTYMQTVARDAGEHSVRVPLVAGPRYMPSKPGPGTRPLRNPNTINPEHGKVNPLSIEFELDAGFEVASVNSAYHPVEIERPAPDRAIGRLKGRHHADRDFVLRWRPVPGDAPELAAFVDRKGEATYALLMLQPPLPDDEAPSPPRELILVIDTSGSMHGDSIDQALSATRHALSTLKPSDRFNLVRFSDRSVALFPASQPAEAAALAEAERFLSRIEAAGGTNMADALRRAFNIPATPDRLRQLVFLTDGAVGNEAALFSLIEAGTRQSRLFTVGIGSAPNDYFMRRAARAGRGTHTFIGRGEEVAASMATLFERLRRPALTDIRIDWHGATTGDAERRVPDLYYGEPLTLTARLKEFRGATVHGRYAGRAWQHRIEDVALSSAPWVSTLWARERIRELNDDLRGGGDRDALKQRITQLGVDHQLVTPYTSLVAVEQRVSRDPNESLHRADVPANLPHGWSYEHVFSALPQTAVGWRARLAMGLVIIALALGLLWLARARRCSPA